jgi:amino acid transporter
MIAWPWYLLSGGIVLIIIGYFLDGLKGLGSRRRSIDPKMSNKEIKRILNEEERISFGSWIMLLGFLMVLVSVGWRLVRGFVSFFSTGP